MRICDGVGSYLQLCGLVANLAIVGKAVFDQISENIGLEPEEDMALESFVPYVSEGLEALIFTADGDMRQATFSGFRIDTKP
ncbi:unnamed protein product [Arabis nemorensis]|uniref:Uncharacterized protein n=1 Tax=Arabis nemorensis TaxID=586526 RepID=A0A565BEM8_9BRAS|nr:unnamed protein product [Arabis nemorensis]